MALIEVNPENFEAEVSQSEIPALVVFLATEWCEPSKRAAPVLEEIATDPKYEGRLKVCGFDAGVYENEAMARDKLGIRATPTAVIYNGSRQQATLIGAGEDYKVRLEGMIDNYLEQHKGQDD